MSLESKFFNLPLVVMGGEQSKVVIPFDDFNLCSDSKFLKEVEDDKRSEKVIYAYTDSGISENGREWKPTHMESLASQVTEKMPVGYLGHIKPSEYGFEFPEPQIVWFGSCTEELTDKNKRLWIKGYLLPTAGKLETWIKTKAVDSISVYGKITYKMKGQIMDIQDIDLKSIDIARKLGEGLNSSIVGVYGEMDATYEDVRNALEKAVKEEVRDDPTQYGFKLPTPQSPVTNGDMMKSIESPYVYAYVRKMYVDDKKAILSVECCNEYKFVEVIYKLNSDNEPIIKSMSEVIEKTTYEKKEKSKSKNEPTNVGEMNKEEVKEMANENITIEDVKANESLYNSIRQAVASEMANENSQQLLVAKAGEMDEIKNLICGVGGEQANVLDTVKKIVNFNAKFVGEMSSIFAGESEEELTPDEIVEATKTAVATVKSVKDAVGVEDDEEVVDKVKEIVDANEEVLAQSAITEVQAEFNKLIAEVTDETIAEFVKDDFADILDITAEDIDDVDAWKEESLEDIKENFKASVDKYTKRLAKAYKKGKAVGEMNALEDLGGNLGTHNKSEIADEDEDIAEARRLGYM